LPARGDNLDGYVLDNMEGAVDQAAFLARTDTPVAIVGARGTGKMYIARIFHSRAGCGPDTLVAIDCREFRNRDDANRRIRHALEMGAGKTLVFKSPQLMSADAQLRLARQIATRQFVDVEPATYLPPMRFVALFPDTLARLVAAGELQPRLASVFAAYPIRVPPMRHRQQAILRWAHKILDQECALRNVVVKGFTPEAEQALREHPWHGNISEIRQRVVNALERRPAGAWLTPVELQLALGSRARSAGLLSPLRRSDREAPGYAPSALEELRQALADVLQHCIEGRHLLPLGGWLQDEVVLAALVRYASDARPAARFLQVPRRNLARWLPGIEHRRAARGACSEWVEPARLVTDWVRGLGQSGSGPLAQAEALLLELLEARREQTTVAQRAQLLGVSRPTYTRRLLALGTLPEAAASG